MTSFIISNQITTAQTLEDGEAGIITDGGMLSVSGSAAIEGQGSNSLLVAGALMTRGFIEQDLKGYLFSGDEMLVSVSQTGYLSTLGNVIEGEVSGYASIVNAGEIETAGSAISLSAASGPPPSSDMIPDTVFEITNQGSMTGVSATIDLELTSSTAAVIRNSGEISATGTTIEARITDFAPLALSPSASEPGELVGAFKLFNSGQITSSAGQAIRSTHGNDEIHNSGLVEGDVFLAKGDDLYDGSGGQVVGQVSGRMGADTLKGGVLEDEFSGGYGADWLGGRRGDDVLSGNRGNDTIRGGRGSDELRGGLGSDRLDGGRGDDFLAGGKGSDVLIFRRSAGDDVVQRFKNGQDKLDLTAFGFVKSDFSTVLAAISKDGKNAVFIDLDQLGGDGSIGVNGLKYGQVDAEDFLL